jgi:hypothetical protein
VIEELKVRNESNLSNVRSETILNFRNKKKVYLKEKLMSLKQTVRKTY